MTLPAGCVILILGYCRRPGAGVISYFALKAITDRTVRSEKEELAEHILYDLAAGMSQYQTIDEMLVYWTDHADELDGQQGAALRRKPAS